MLLVGCTVGALSFAVGDRRSPRPPIAHREDEAGNDGAGAVGVVHAVGVRPAAIATWRFGEIAVDAARSLLKDGGTALDALEEGTALQEVQPYFRVCRPSGAYCNTVMCSAVLCSVSLFLTISPCAFLNKNQITVEGRPNW